MIERTLTNQVIKLLNEFPAVAILGPRQVGKTTLAKNVAKHILPSPLYLDLERPSDLAKLSAIILLIELKLKCFLECIKLYQYYLLILSSFYRFL